MPSKKKAKIENLIVINVADKGANEWFMDVYYKLRGSDEVVISTRHLRWLLNRVVDLYTKEGIKLCHEVDRWVSDDDEIFVRLRIIGAVR